MRTKEILLSLLKAGNGAYISGEELAQRLSLSRASVWKAVSALRKDGYEIDAATNKGYRLSPQNDVLSTQGVRNYLSPALQGMAIEVLPVASSTNTILRQRALGAARSENVLIAASQTEGRGRRGRSFFSPADSGVYMSLLLQPEHYTAGQAEKLTAMAALAACEAIEAVSQKSAAIKWVNDIYIAGKKVCGILTEASFDLESGLVDSIVLGIGFNAYLPREGFPPGIAHTAGAIFEAAQPDGKNRLAAAFLNHFWDAYSQGTPSDFAARYRRRNLAIGREVQVLSPMGAKTAFALDVDDDCHLLVRYQDGSTAQLASGEISLQL